MSDNEIREILIKQRIKERKMERRADMISAIEGAIGFGGMAILGLMLAVIG